MAELKNIEVRGAREHNLKNIQEHLVDLVEELLVLDQVEVETLLP